MRVHTGGQSAHKRAEGERMGGCTQGGKVHTRERGRGGGGQNERGQVRVHTREEREREGEDGQRQVD